MPKLNIDALLTEFGARYDKGSQGEKDIRTEIFAQDDIMKDFQRVPWESDTYVSVYASIDEVMQAFVKEFNDKSETVFTPWRQKLGEYKIDKILYPDELRHSWTGFWATIEEKDRSKWPIIRWLISKQLLPAAKRDFLLKAAYWGWQYTGFQGVPVVDGATFVREAAAADAVHPANASVDGLRTQIAKMVDAGRTAPIATGAPSADPATFAGQVETFVFGIPEEVRPYIDAVYMAPVLQRRFRAGMRVKYNTNYLQEAELDTVADTNIKVKGTVAMTASNQMWATIPANRKYVVRTEEGEGRFDLQKIDRGVKFLADYRYIPTFDVPEYVYTNDQETTISAQDIIDHYS